MEEQQPEQEQQETATEGKSNKKLTSEQKSTLKRLQERPKKTIFIPEDPLNPDDLVVPISVNGVTYSIPRGKEFEVPDVIADIWAESYSKTAAANRKIKVQQELDITIRS
ncbi:hypothetical protein RB620_04415 [Paenibacillus sp. LHD-117]|uniref:hypothetical protein n=1 Tax=Paenibacillus sp. LHD-117 TaxID=3071412 RepID=UPI0027DEB626|nr:hypothetical protein [Paenibacillus sp. LHD-117]MDQ6418676.1 hypothetical protein [Paenibacillus sp. LHD-117]